jgi:hypothetical protein
VKGIASSIEAKKARDRIVSPARGMYGLEEQVGPVPKPKASKRPKRRSRKR